MNEWLTVFVDECGTNELDSAKNGVSNLFICVAVLVKDADLPVLSSSIQQISDELCGGAPIASKRIGKDHARRLIFLRRVMPLSFSYFALMINKDRIPKESGLQYKRSFYKYINRMLYERILKERVNCRIVAHRIGGKDFMDSFEPYLIERGMPGLFEDVKHEFATTEDAPLLGIADLTAGTLAYCFDEAKPNTYVAEFRNIMRQREIAVKCWPWDSASRDASTKASTLLDATLEQRMTDRVVRFLNEHFTSPQDDRKMQVSVLSSLFFAREFEERAHQALVAENLINKLSDEGFEDISRQAFQSRVIGKIRDDGIILSGASDGYRLALSVADIQEYLDHDRSIIEPMLARMLKARESASFDTDGTYDILANYKSLMELANAFSDHNIGEAAGRDRHEQDGAN